ncbi:MAG: hypothetical protein KU37_04470 [Sulfuricurvum sp. PC08-66]|nr:MAG: hypothetical protein KU37_04470 [Sulfuricurvum sp. PC08-66]
MSFALTPAHAQRLEHLRSRYETPRSLILPLLWMAQTQEGYLSPEALAFVAHETQLCVADVTSVASFYTMFALSPQGHHTIEVCGTLSCHLNGASQLIEALQKTLGITLGQTTADGAFTLKKVECMGACHEAPVVVIDGVYHARQNVQSLTTLLEETRS